MSAAPKENSPVAPPSANQSAPSGQPPAGVSAGRGMQLGLELGVSVVVCTLAGIWADKTFGTVPLFILLGLVLGFSAGMWHLYRVAVGAKATEVGFKPAPAGQKAEGGSKDEEKQGG